VLVDNKYFECIGKRRSWIIPAQLLAGLMMYYMGCNFDEIMQEKSLLKITSIFAIVFFCLSIQDIAVDAWSITIVKEENLSYSSTCQNIGLSMGMFISTTMYFALNSIELCNSYIRPFYVDPEILNSTDETNPYLIPIMNEVIFMKGWGVLIIIVSIYVLLMHSEEDDRIISSNSDDNSSMRDTYKTLKGLLMNSNLHYLIIFWAGFSFFNCFGAVTTIYLLQEKNYDQMKYSFLSAISFPIEIILSFVISKKVYENPFKFLYYCQFFGIPISFIYINMLLYYYDELVAYDPMLFDFCLLLLTLVSTLVCTVKSACTFAQFNKI
jgi:MFS transporter, PAT family, solute carrier family 33 (acetyl-CoA transportor), member 1